jgi:hypothetical protein
MKVKIKRGWSDKRFGFDYAAEARGRESSGDGF